MTSTLRYMKEIVWPSSLHPPSHYLQIEMFMELSLPGKPTPTVQMKIIILCVVGRDLTEILLKRVSHFQSPANLVAFGFAGIMARHFGSQVHRKMEGSTPSCDHSNGEHFYSRRTSRRESERRKSFVKFMLCNRFG